MAARAARARREAEGDLPAAGSPPCWTPGRLSWAAGRPDWYSPVEEVEAATEAWLAAHALTREQALAELEARRGLGCACPGSPIVSVVGAPCGCALWVLCFERAVGVTPLEALESGLA